MERAQGKEEAAARGVRVLKRFSLRTLVLLKITEVPKELLLIWVISFLIDSYLLRS